VLSYLYCFPAFRCYNTVTTKLCVYIGLNMTSFVCMDYQLLRMFKSHRVFSVEFCRGELIGRDGILRHWTEDATDLFTGGDLLYCGGCCGQHVATKTCNEHLMTTGEGKPLQVKGLRGDLPGSGCDDWIDCFVYQCQVCQ